MGEIVPLYPNPKLDRAVNALDQIGSLLAPLRDMGVIGKYWLFRFTTLADEAEAQLLKEDHQWTDRR